MNDMIDAEDFAALAGKNVKWIHNHQRDYDFPRSKGSVTKQVGSKNNQLRNMTVKTWLRADAVAYLEKHPPKPDRQSTAIVLRDKNNESSSAFNCLAKQFITRPHAGASHE